MLNLMIIIFVLSQIFSTLIFGGIAVTAIVYYMKVRKENYDIWEENSSIRNDNHELDVEITTVTGERNRFEMIICAMTGGGSSVEQPFEEEIDRELLMTRQDKKEISIH